MIWPGGIRLPDPDYMALKSPSVYISINKVAALAISYCCILDMWHGNDLIPFIIALVEHANLPSLIIDTCGAPISCCVYCCAHLLPCTWTCDIWQCCTDLFIIIEPSFLIDTELMVLWCNYLMMYVLLCPPSSSHMDIWHSINAFTHFPSDSLIYTRVYSTPWCIEHDKLPHPNWRSFWSSSSWLWYRYGILH